MNKMLHKDPLIRRAADSDTAVPVVDADGRMVGDADRSIVMHAMMVKS